MENFAEVSELNILLGSELGLLVCFLRSVLQIAKVYQKWLFLNHVLINLQFLKCHTLLSHLFDLFKKKKRGGRGEAKLYLLKSCN